MIEKKANYFGSKILCGYRHGCRNHFTPRGREIDNPVQLRGMAAKVGWTAPKTIADKVTYDLCPEHSKAALR